MEMAVEDLAGGVTRVALSGRLDVAGAGRIDLRFSVLAGSRKALVVDLSQVSFLASMGLRTLLTGARTVRSKGGKMVLLSPDANVAKVLEIAGVETLLPIYHDAAAALAAAAA